MIIFNSKQSNEHGFTLIELLVSIGVLSIISGVGVTIFLSLAASYDKADVVNKLNQEGSRVMDQTVRLIRNSSDAQLDPLSGTDEIILTIPAEPENLEFSTNGGCREIRLFLDGTSIRKTAPLSECESPDPPCTTTTPCTLTSSNVLVNSLEFAVVQGNNSPDQVRIVFEIRQSASLSDPEQQASQVFARTVLTRGY